MLYTGGKKMGLFGGLVDSVKKVAGIGGGAGGVAMGAAAFPMFAPAIPILGPDIYNAYNAQRNYDFQRENYAYQQAIQRKIFRREDSSIQRRVADLRKAGLSPVLGAGSGADAGAVVKTDVPQRAPFQSDAANKVMSLITMANGIDMSLIQRKLLQSQVANQNINTAIKAHDLGIFKQTGTTSNAGSIPNLIRNIVGGSESPILQPVKKQFEQKINDAKNEFFLRHKTSEQKNKDYDTIENQRLKRR